MSLKDFFAKLFGSQSDGKEEETATEETKVKDATEVDQDKGESEISRSVQEDAADEKKIADEKVEAGAESASDQGDVVKPENVVKEVKTENVSAQDEVEQMLAKDPQQEEVSQTKEAPVVEEKKDKDNVAGFSETISEKVSTESENENTEK